MPFVVSWKLDEHVVVKDWNIFNDDWNIFNGGDPVECIAW